MHLSNPDILPCVYASSPFDEKYHGHKISDELPIINNSRLRNIFCPKYRENPLVHLGKVKNYIWFSNTHQIKNYNKLNKILLIVLY